MLDSDTSCSCLQAPSFWFPHPALQLLSLTFSSCCFLPLVFSLSPLFLRKERTQFLINQISALSERSEAGAQNTLDQRPERAEGFTCWIWKLGFDVTLLRLSWDAACLLVASASLLDRGKLSGWSRREACPLHEG